MKTRFKQNNNKLEKMLRYATLRSEVLESHGLNGKIGMAILFFDYSSLYQDILFQLYAEELLDSVLETLSTESLNIQEGLSGIAWGIVYLHKKRFIEGNIREILSEVDEYLEANIQEAEKDILTYLAYRDGIVTDKKIYSEKDVLDIIWANWGNWYV